MNKYSAQEVSKHRTAKDAWIIIHGKVYDVTKFLDEHPGGEEVLIDQAGKDATDAFEEIGHSAEARDLLKKYIIGLLDQDLPRISISSHETVKKNEPKLKERQIRSSPFPTL